MKEQYGVLCYTVWLRAMQGHLGLSPWVWTSLQMRSKEVQGLCVLLWLLCSCVFSRGQLSPQRSLRSSLTGMVVRACCSSRPRLHPRSSMASRVCGESTCSRDSFCPSLTTLCSINVSLVGVVAALLGKTDCVPVSFSLFHSTRHIALQSTPR